MTVKTRPEETLKICSEMTELTPPGQGNISPFSWSLFKILCKCLVSEVTVQAVTELDNKAAHCHSPVLQRHRPFLGRRLDCQPHHFFHRVVCREVTGSFKPSGLFPPAPQK